MPNKTIYVPEDDLPIFARAQTLAGGNLSATISGALRDFVARHENAEVGPVEVKVGQTAYTFQRFQGRLLAEGMEPLSDGRPPIRYSVYQTARGQVAVHRADPPDRRSFGSYDREAVHAWMNDHAILRLNVYPTLDEAAAHLPADLVDAVRLAQSGQTFLELDI